MTIKLSEIEKAAEGATAGPWEADGTEVSQHWSRPEPWLPVATNEVACMTYCYGGSARGIENEADATFIAASRTAIPALTAALRDVLAILDAHERTSPEGREQWNADIRAAITAHVDPT